MRPLCSNDGKYHEIPKAFNSSHNLISDLAVPVPLHGIGDTKIMKGTPPLRCCHSSDCSLALFWMRQGRPTIHISRPIQHEHSVLPAHSQQPYKLIIRGKLLGLL